ncbi:MAG TPA: O-methyltransferase [Gaiellaceae bacterium]|nr:O-methyltransferase [Gaiellaceae bacterium]
MPSPDEHWTAVDRYLTDLLITPDPALEAALEGGLPSHSVSPLQGKLLHVLARTVQARTVLELGTLGGYSTIWLARALPADGRVVTIEADPARADLARRNLERAGLDRVAEVRVARALDALAELVDDGAGPFDLIFVDADKEENAAYLPPVLELSQPGTLIVADNVVRGGAVADADSGDPVVRGVRRFYELLAGEPRVTATVLQTVGAKGYDGFALALVTR